MLPFVITPEPSLYFLTGPTAVGKTELGLAWAEEHGMEILSCDSLLVYQGMNIGTAKPTPEELGCVPHHGIDCVPVTHAYNVKEYVTMALEVVADVFARGKSVLVLGGSGFYLKSFFEPVVDDTAVSQEVVDRVQMIYESGGLEVLLDELHALNPEGLDDLDVKNPRRLVKALQRCLATGQTIQELRGRFQNQLSPFVDYKKQVCLLARDNDALKMRALLRVEHMVASGLIEEVESLRSSGLLENPSAARAIGYRETLEWLENPTTEEVLINTIAQNTYRLIRKQRIWFRSQIAIDYTLDLL